MLLEQKGERMDLRLIKYLSICLIATGCATHQAGLPIPVATSVSEGYCGHAMGGVTVQWLGVSTLYFSDGQSSFFIDGFFTRPSIKEIITAPLAHDEARMKESLDRAAIRSAGAVLVSHNHYDHIMDAPWVANRFAALLYVPDELHKQKSLRDATRYPVLGFPHKTFDVGRFKITAVRTQHSPTFLLAQLSEAIQEFFYGVHFEANGSFSFLIKHDCGTFAVIPSANSEGGMFGDQSPQVVFLGIGRLGRQNSVYASQYFDQTIGNQSVKYVMPIHWDDFTKPFDSNVPLPSWVADDVHHAMTSLINYASKRQQAPQVSLLPAFAPVRILPLPAEAAVR